MNALVYVDININIANFEAFLLVFKLTKNLFFLKSDRLGMYERFYYLYFVNKRCQILNRTCHMFNKGYWG